MKTALSSYYCPIGADGRWVLYGSMGGLHTEGNLLGAVSKEGGVQSTQRDAADKKVRVALLL